MTSLNAFVYIAPSSSPRNVQSISLSSTAIQVSWAEVPILDRNGLITLYEILYESNDTLESLARRTTNATGMFVILTDLHPFVTYAISVRAYTSEGHSPYSDVIFERTEEDGKKVDFFNSIPLR